MPWLRSRTERSSGLTTWAIEWREGKNGAKGGREITLAGGPGDGCERL